MNEAEVLELKELVNDPKKMMFTAPIQKKDPLRVEHLFSTKRKFAIKETKEYIIYNLV